MIISSVTILLLIFGEAKAENEMKCIFPSQNFIPSKEEAQFLGWMSSNGKSDCKEKIKRIKDEQMAMTENTPSFIVKSETDQPSGFCLPEQNIEPDIILSKQFARTAPAWKTLIVGDSTVHYIPLDGIGKSKPQSLGVISVEDAVDPFFSDPFQFIVSDKESFSDKKKTNKKFNYAMPRQRQKNLKSLAYRPAKQRLEPIIQRLPFETHSFQNYELPIVHSKRGKLTNTNQFINKGKTGSDVWSQEKHTMFVHPKLLQLMKSMDHSILSYPSRFEYKSLEQLPPLHKKGMSLNKYRNKGF